MLGEQFPRRVLPVEGALDAMTRFLSSGPKHWFLDIESSTRVQVSGAVELLASLRTQYQQLDILLMDGYGLCMVLDGRMQLAESDEWIYHELLVHPACAIHGNPRKALVLGGGDGCALREILRYRHLQEVTLVDIDEEVVAAFRDRFFALNQGALRDSRVTLVRSDALAFLKGHSDGYDLIFSDLTEPYDVTELAGDLSSHLYSPTFYALVRDRLSTRGIFACQTGGVRFQPRHDRFHTELLAGLRDHFPHTLTCYEFVPSFAELWSLTLASSMPLEIDPSRVDETLLRLGVTGLRYYDGVTHRRTFTAPRGLRHRQG